MPEVVSRVRVDVDTDSLRQAGESVGNLADRYRRYVRELPRGVEQMRRWNSEVRELQRWAGLSVEKLESLKPAEFERLHETLKRNQQVEKQISAEYERRDKILREIQRLQKEFQQDRARFVRELAVEGNIPPRVLGGMPGVERTLFTAEERARREVEALGQVARRQAESQAALTRAAERAAPAAAGAGGGRGMVPLLFGRGLRGMLGIGAGLLGAGTFVGTMRQMGTEQHRLWGTIYRAALAGGAVSPREIERLYERWNENGPGNEFLERLAQQGGITPQQTAQAMLQYARVTGRFEQGRPELIGRLLRAGALAGDPSAGVAWGAQLYRTTLATEDQTTAMLTALVRFHRNYKIPLQEMFESNLHLVNLLRQERGTMTLEGGEAAGLLLLQGELAGLPQGVGRGVRGIQNYAQFFHGRQGIQEYINLETYRRLPRKFGGGGGQYPATPEDILRFEELVKYGGFETTPEARVTKARVMQELGGTLGENTLALLARGEMSPQAFRLFYSRPPDYWATVQGKKEWQETFAGGTGPATPAAASGVLLEGMFKNAFDPLKAELDSFGNVVKGSRGQMELSSEAIKQLGHASLDAASSLQSIIRQKQGEHPALELFTGPAVGALGTLLAFLGLKRGGAAAGRLARNLAAAGGEGAGGTLSRFSVTSLLALMPLLFEGDRPAFIHDIEHLSTAPTRRQMERFAEAEARRQGLDPAVVKAVIQKESRFQPFVHGTHGEIGAMQVKPAAAAEVGVTGLGENWQAEIVAGTSYLKKLLEGPAHGDLQVALAMYNMGPAGVGQKRLEELPASVRHYVADVMRYRAKFAGRQGELPDVTVSPPPPARTREERLAPEAPIAQGGATERERQELIQLLIRLNELLAQGITIDWADPSLGEILSGQGAPQPGGSAEARPR